MWIAHGCHYNEWMEGIQSVQKLYLLGTPRLERKGLIVTISRRKSLALLAYLAVTKQPQIRDGLLTLFWPRYSTDHARQYLRRDLSGLRKVVGKALLPGDKKQIRLAAEAGMWVDVLAFCELLALVAKHQHEEAHCSECLPRLEKAVGLYRNDFMAGFGLDDAPAFDDWQSQMAEALRHELAGALKKIISALIALGRFDDALPHARSWLALDPLHEPAQRQLMQLLAWSGHVKEATAQFEASRVLLRDELQVEPESATLRLAEAIQTGRLALPEVSGKGDVRGGPVEENHALFLTALPRRPLHNLPWQTTPLIGREAELTDLSALLANPDKRLITIVAPGGMGKTRLALAAAGEQLTGQLFPHGIYFVNLAPLTATTQIHTALAVAVRLPLEGSDGQARPTRRQLFDYLYSKKMLLIMDNFEHLAEGADLVTELLQEAPGVRILATSRERLHLREEQLYTLGGLQTPEVEIAPEPAEFAAVKLFLQAAVRVSHHYRPSPNDLTWIGKICRDVGGMPLAVELAAGWVDALSIEEIAAEIQFNLDFLETDLRNVPERQRSMRAVLTATWGRLGELEQELLARLATFRGGFSRGAAQTIAGANLRSLFHLANRSLLQYDRKRDRYRIHELLRQFAAEKLAALPESRRQVEAEHSRYYCGLVASHLADLLGEAQPQALELLDQDLDNINRAWQLAVEQGARELLFQAADALGYWHEWRGRYESSLAQFTVAATSIDVTDDLLGVRLLARLLTWQTVFLQIQGNGQASEQLLRRCLALLADHPAWESDTRREKAFALLRSGIGGGLPAGQGEALTNYRQSLQLFEVLNDKWGVARAMEKLGLAQLFIRTNHDEVNQLLAGSLAIYREFGNQRSSSRLLGWLALSASFEGRFEVAERYARDCLQICRQLGNRADLAYGLESHGMMLAHLGHLAQALQRLEEVLAINRELGNREQGRWTRSNYGDVLLMDGRIQEARLQFELARKESIALGADLETRAFYLGKLAAVANEMAAFDQALAYAQQSVAFWLQSGGQNTITASAYTALARAHYGLGKEREAQHDLSIALARAIAGRHFLVLMGDVMQLLAKILADQGDQQQAVAIDALLTRYYPLYSRSDHLIKTHHEPIMAKCQGLNPDIVTRIREQSQQIGPWQFAAEMLAYITQLGWPEADG